MKFRLRGEAFKIPILVEFEGSNVSVSELKGRISEILNILEEDVKDIKLSMNGKQTIEFQDDNLLSSLGFVSGDSIYIMGIQSQDEPAAKNVKSDKAASMVEQKQDLRNKSHPVQSVAVEQPSTSSEKDGQYISVCDTPPSAVPQALEELMKKSKMTSSSSAFELIAGLLHILMVETGFIPVTKNLEWNAYITLPDSWQDNGHGTLRLCYKAALSPNSPCTIIVSAMNHLIVVHGAVSDVSRSMKLKPSDYLPLIGGNRLRQLSLSFKNEISFPLLVSMQRQAEGYCPANLSNLPAEMLYSILSRLDVKSLCRLSATSRFFREISNRPEMWKKLVLRDFGKKHSGAGLSESTDWKQIYQDELKVARQRKNLPLTSSFRPPWNPFGYLGGPFTHSHDARSPINFPGILGGEDDLRPNLGPFAAPSRRDPFHRETGLPPFMNNRNRGFPEFPRF